MRDNDLAAIESALRGFLTTFEPGRVPVVYAAVQFDQAVAIERLASSVVTLMARRMEDAQGYKRAGCRSAAEQVAKASGTSVSAARRRLETSKQLAELPSVVDAVRAGVLSTPAVEAIAGAAAVVPEAAERLVRVAADSTYAEVRDACLEARASGDRDGTYARIRSGRFVREWTDAEGAWNLSARGTVDDGARFRAAIGPVIDAIFRERRATDEREPRDAYAFDALMQLVTDERSPESTKPTARFMSLVRVDHEALLRGWSEDDEICEIAGLGPIPASIARQVLGESLMKLVITKGSDVLNVTHLGRRATVAQQVALWWRDPICTRLGCTRAYRLEIDHRRDWADTHHTRVDESDRLCDHDHWLKTVLGWALVEGTGRRDMVPPDDPRHPNNKPRPPPGE